MLNHELLGETLDARIIRQHRDSFDCKLFYTGKEISALGRLYIDDTALWQPSANFVQKQKTKFHKTYPIDKILRVRVISAKRKSPGNELKLYLNERLADRDNNELLLKRDDEVSGWAMREIPGMGWIVQLDFSRSIRNHPERDQPDITVLAKFGDMPGVADGLKRPLTIERGDALLGSVFSLPVRPEDNYTISIKSSLVSLDTQLLHENTSPHPRAVWHWHQMGKRGKANNNPSEDSTLPLQQLFRGDHFFMVEDDPKTLAMRRQRLEDNGAKVSSYAAPVALSVENISDSIVRQVTEKLPDVLLLDYACPSEERGVKIAQQVLEKLEAKGLAITTAICGSFITKDNREQIFCQAPRLQGVLLRPLHIDSLIRLLTGERVNDEKVALPELEHFQKTIPVEQWLEDLYERENLDGLAVGRQIKRQKVHWDYAKGHFTHFTHLGSQSAPTLYRRTDLAQLLDGNPGPLLYAPKETMHTDLLHSVGSHTCWWRFEQDNLIWIVGIASKKPFPARALLQEALESGLAYSTVKNNLSLHAELLSSGLLIQALTHEFYNRIAGMRLQANFLEDLTERLRDKTQAQLLSNTKNLEAMSKRASSSRQEADELEQLIEGIMHGLSHRRKPTPLPSLFERLRRICALLEKQFSHQVYLVQPPPLSVSVPLSVVSLALVNLIHNSGKHGNRNSGLQQRVFWDIAFEQTTEGKSVPKSLRLVLQDNGLGISTFQAERLFLPGQSFADDQEKRHGLGLWLSKTLLNRYHADLRLEENAVGWGCRFVIELPFTLEMGHEQ